MISKRRLSPAAYQLSPRFGFGLETKIARRRKLRRRALEPVSIRLAFPKSSQGSSEPGAALIPSAVLTSKPIKSSGGQTPAKNSKRAALAVLDASIASLRIC
jgi:hypothetical protein